MTLAAIARLLNVRKEERWLVSKLFWMQFFQGAGVAFFFTSAYATFLYNHEVSDLSFVYIYTSILLWITGFIYDKLEHKFHVSDFSRFIVWFMAGSILLIRIFGSVSIPGFDYFILIWFNVLYLLSNLEFWGIAALVFEVRQSKRLFSIISAGDIPAKFIGYTLASLTVSYIGTANLLIPSFLCMIASLPFLNAIIKSGTLHDHEEKHESHTHGQRKKLIGTFIRKFVTNKLILWLGILSFIMSVCIVVTNFSFYSKIKEAYQSDIELAVFIGLFLAIIRICALLVKLLLTSRIVDSLGVKKSLLLTPVIFTGCIVLVILLRYVLGTEAGILYMFGITCIVLDVLKTAINSPVFLSIMQPLNIHDRLHSHNIVKGIMDPFAYLFSGVFLFELIKIQHGIDLTALLYFLLLFAIGWIACIPVIHREYYITLLKAITSKFYNRSDLVIDDADTISLINKKLESGTEAEIIHILRLIRFQQKLILNNEIAEKLLEYGSSIVKSEILAMFQAGLIQLQPKTIQGMADDANNPLEVRHNAFKMLCNPGTEGSIIFSYATHQDPFMQSYALGSILQQPEKSAYFTKASKLVHDLFNSENVQSRITAAHAIACSKNEAFKGQLIQLINDNENAVSTAAINATGDWPDEQLVTTVLKHIKTKKRMVMDALLKAGQVAVPYIAAYILSNEATYEERMQLIRICGAIGGEATTNVLIDLCNTLPEHTHTIAKAIYNAHPVNNTNSASILEAVAQKCTEDAAAILKMQKQIGQNGEKRLLLMNTLSIELRELRESLLYLFSVLYKDAEIEKVRRAFALNSREQIANAFEMLEITVPKKLSHDFIVIYEKGDIEHRVAQLYNRKGAGIKGVKEISSYILRSNEAIFLDWSKSCAAYTLYKDKIQYDNALVKRYLYAENPVLKETANFALNNLMDNKLLLLEKVLVLKRTAIFSETPENILADLAPLMQEIEYPEGKLIFREGSIGDSMYIIYQGSVRIHKGDTTLAILDKENDVFGELSLFDSEKRSASATAHTDCFLFKIDQLPFYELIETRPEIIKGAVKMLCKRLRIQNERTVEIQKGSI